MTSNASSGGDLSRNYRADPRVKISEKEREKSAGSRRHCFPRHGVDNVDETPEHDQCPAKGRQDIQGGVRLLLRHASKISPLSFFCPTSAIIILMKISSSFKDSPTGLYVSLTSFLGLGQEHVMWYYDKTSYPVYLHIKRTRKEVILIYSANYIEELLSLNIGTVCAERHCI